jgi:hypothetical protein
MNAAPGKHAWVPGWREWRLPLRYAVKRSGVTLSQSPPMILDKPNYLDDRLPAAERVALEREYDRTANFVNANGGGATDTRQRRPEFCCQRR